MIKEAIARGMDISSAIFSDPDGHSWQELYSGPVFFERFSNYIEVSVCIGCLVMATWWQFEANFIPCRGFYSTKYRTNVLENPSQVDVISSLPEEHRKWLAWVESRLRQFMVNVEVNSIVFRATSRFLLLVYYSLWHVVLLYAQIPLVTWSHPFAKSIENKTLSSELGHLVTVMYHIYIYHVQSSNLKPDGRPSL